MNKNRQRWTTGIGMITFAFFISIVAPVPGLAQSDDDENTGWITQDRDRSNEKLDVMLDVSPRPFMYGVVHNASIQVANGTAIDRKVEINALLGEVAHFVGGDHGVRFQHPDKAEQQRAIMWPVLNLPAGAMERVSFQFLVSWDISGDVYLQVDAGTIGNDDPVEVAHLRETPQLPDGDYRGFLAQYGSGVIFFLLFIMLQVALFQHTRRKGGGLLKTLSQVGAVLFIFFSVAGLWNALEPWFGWQATTCEVLDVRYFVETGRSTENTSGGRATGGRSITAHSYRPLLTLRYDGPDGPIVSSGFRNESSAAGDMGLLAQFRAGTTTDCHYDPDDPGWVVITRDVNATTVIISLVYSFAAVLLGWFGFLRRKTRITGSESN
jgi:hypothetical protein